MTWKFVDRRTSGHRSSLASVCGSIFCMFFFVIRFPRRGKLRRIWYYYCYWIIVLETHTTKIPPIWLASLSTSRVETRKCYVWWYVNQNDMQKLIWFPAQNIIFCLLVEGHLTIGRMVWVSYSKPAWNLYPLTPMRQDKTRWQHTTEIYEPQVILLSRLASCRPSL